MVAIDGPAGAGKSTTARLCAKKLGFFYINTGAMYRAIALKIVEEFKSFKLRRPPGLLKSLKKIFLL